MSQASGGVTRQDILAAYEMILQRSPEGEWIYDFHSTYPDRFAMGRAFLNSIEFRAAHPAASGMQTYPGYLPGEQALLHRFERYTGPGTPGFTTNYLGVRLRTGFVSTHAPFDGTVEGVPEPEGSLQGETAEWLGVLKSVLDASGSYRMMELGAGFGPWMTITSFAARQRGITDIRLYGVEGDAGHVEFMRQHLSDNAIDPAAHVLLHGAVGPEDGVANWGEVADPAQVYGGRPLGADGLDFPGAVHTRHVSLPMFGIAGLLGREARWDLVHIDIQGGEAEVCRAGIAEMNARVKRVVLGTHSRALDGECMAIFHAAGWSLEHEKPTMMRWVDGVPTLEATVHVDGVQVWRNPRLASPVI